MKNSLVDMEINVKKKLSALWVAVVVCYLYVDFLGLMKTGHLSEIIGGESLGMQITQEMLLGIAILMAIPSVMVFLSLTLPAKANRWANIILGIFYTGFMLITMLLPGAWAYYIFLGIVEVVLTALIVWHAWKWPTQEASPTKR